MPNYVVIYTHRHGADAWLATSENEGWLSACIQLWQYIEDIESDAACKDIAKLILDKEYANAAESLAGYLLENIEVRKVLKSTHDEDKFRTQIEEWLKANTSSGETDEGS